jgi:hypothetical protein
VKNLRVTLCSSTLIFRWLKIEPKIQSIWSFQRVTQLKGKQKLQCTWSFLRVRTLTDSDSYCLDWIVLKEFNKSLNRSKGDKSWQILRVMCSSVGCVGFFSYIFSRESSTKFATQPAHARNYVRCDLRHEEKPCPLGSSRWLKNWSCCDGAPYYTHVLCLSRVAQLSSNTGQV